MEKVRYDVKINFMTRAKCDGATRVARAELAGQQASRPAGRTISPAGFLACWPAYLVKTLPLGLACLLPLLAVPARGQQVVQGQPGQATVRSTVHFRGLANLVQQFGLGQGVRKTNHPPMPLERITNQPPGGGGFQAAGAPVEPSFTAAAVPLPPSPVPTATFPALEDNMLVIPPDTHGAAGPNHLMIVLNTEVRIQDKNGGNISTVPLDTFWESLGSPIAFDPKVLYDPYANRWMFTACADARSPRSSIMIAVSQTSDPTGNWFLYRVDGDPNNLDWIDYPSIGFNKDWIVVSVNMFPILPTAIGYSGVNLYVFNKTNLYANGVGRFTLLREASTVGFTMVPAMTYDDEVATMHLVEVDNLFYNFTTDSTRLRFSTITGPVGAEVLTIGTAFTPHTNAWGSASFFRFFGGFAPQLGSFFGIDNNDSRIQNLVYRNGSLWCAQTIFLPATLPTHSAVQWWELDPSGTVLQFGRIQDITGTTNYAFPSIAVNRNEDALIGFSRFSAFQYASANYAFRACSDPPNRFRGEVVLKAGEAPYFKTFPGFPGLLGFRNRWGDYSSTVVDPVDDFQMWTIQEYAATPTNGSLGFIEDRWGTWWGRISPTETCFSIEFVTSAYTVNEATPGFATISVLNLGGGAGTVDFATSDGTALAGQDYLARTGTLTFSAGQTETNFIVIVLDNAVVNSNKTFNVTLSNPTGVASLGRIATATVTIVDDETAAIVSTAGEFNFSSYLNDGAFYLASEFETFLYPNPPGCGAPYTILNPPERTADGVLITVVRTNGSTGRVLVDYSTVDDGFAIPFVDYIPISGTLVFDDSQTSTNFLVEVLPSSFFFLVQGVRFIQLALSNARPAPEEEIERPGTIQPKLGLGSLSTLLVYPTAFDGILFTNNVFSFERNNWRIDEYETANQVGGYREFNIQVLNPTGEAGSVRLRTKQYDPSPASFAIDSGRFGFLRSVLQAGSDFAEAPFPYVFQGIEVFPQPNFTDPALTTITNVSDYFATNVVLTFAQDECRKNVTLILTNDPTVEFNEDIILILTRVPNNRGVNSFGSIASVTIVQNDQPAGALDREWNVYGIPASDPPNNLTPGTDGVVRALATQPDGQTILGGDFEHVNSVRRPGIARMGTNGVMDRSFTPGDGVNVRSGEFVTSLILYPASSPLAGRILVAGGFSSYNGVQRNGVARILANGQLDTSFVPGNGANGPVWGMALQADGKVVVVGSFTEFNDFTRNGVARMNPDGTLDQGFDPGAGPNGVAYAVGLSRDPAGGPEQIVVGGSFSFFNNEFNSGIVQLNPDGSLDLNFQTGGGLNGFVNSLVVQSNNAVIVAGYFSEVDAKRRINLARFNPDGSLDSTFDPGFGPDSQVFTITLDNFEKPLIGGPFVEFNGTRRMGLARLRRDGTLDTSFLDSAYNHFAGLPRTFSFEPPNYVSAIALQPDGKVMIGGSFTNVGGNPSIRTPLRNPYTVFTRADKQIRFNLARLIGGATPGPGNAEFDSDEYFVMENANIASVQLQRSDGRLGGLGALAATADRAATNGLDYLATNFFNTWRAGYLVPPDGNNFDATMSVGQVRDVFFRIAIINDTLQEGDENVNLSFLQPGGSIILGGEYIPLGGALGRYKAVLNIGEDDVNRGIFGFGAASFATNEVARILQVPVIRTNGSIGTVSVDYFTRNSTNTPLATANVDYSVLRRTPLFFGPGETQKVIFVNILEDNDVEFDENFELVLTNATGGARLPGGLSTSIATTTLTIIDSDLASGRLNFSSVTYTTNENAGYATVQVTRTGGSQGAVSVQFATANGTATAPADFVATNGTLSWNALDTSARNIVIPLVADGIVDNNTNRFESFSVRLFNPIVGATPDPRLLGNRTNAVFLIEDSDNYGVLAFNQSFYQADENGGSVAITVVRRNGVAGAVSADYVITPADPSSAGTDYVPATGTLVFLPGETAKSFSITLLDDQQSDGNKDLGLSLANLNNATVGTPHPVTLTIIDNESVTIPAGDNDLTFVTNTIINGPVYAIALQSEGRILAAGEFTEVNNVTRASVARLLSNGDLDTSFDPLAGPNGPIRAMSLQPDNKILLGGLFVQFNNTNRPGLVRLLSDGTVDSAFNPGAGANNAVYALQLQADDKILVGGSFSTFNSISRPGIVRLNTNGTVDATFDPGAGANNPVYAVGLQSDGKILVGGDFTLFRGQSRGRLVRLNANGSFDPSFNSGVTFNGAVRAILVQPDGKIVVGGSFTTANGVARNYLARLNSDGSLDGGFLTAPLAGADNAVFALAQQVDGKLIVAGDFQTFNSVTRRRMTRLNPDGTTDPTINFGNGADAFIATVAIQPDRKIVFGGDFSTFDDVPRQRIARIHGGSLAGSGALEFARAEFLVQENATNALITIRRRQGTTGAVGVNYQTLDGTALAGTHYLTTAGTAIFPEGETRFNFLVPILNDSLPGGDTFLGLNLINGTYTGGATNGPQPLSRLVILDDEGSIGFEAADFAVGENVASLFATIRVRRFGATNSTASVSFASGTSGTATPFLDFFPTNGTLTFLPGETAKSFHVRILNDTLVELNETIPLTLSNPSGSNVLSIATATLLILEDDFAFGQFVFSTTAYSVAENGTNVFLTVLRTNGNTGVASVRYRTSDNTATGDSDYVATNNILAFPDGVTALTIQIPILDDLLVETPEQFNVILFNPTGGATLGPASSAAVTITDNDISSVIPAGSTLISESLTNNGIIDPGETVTMSFAVRNIGSGNTPSLTGTLLAGNGVSLSAGPQIRPYGVLLANGPAVAQTFTFSASGAMGSSLVATLLLTDGTATNGFVSFAFTVGGQASRTFTNSGGITINDDTVASPYPSTIDVANMGGTITRLTVSFTNFTHRGPRDVDVLLVGPGGQKVTLMSDAGTNVAVTNLRLTFSDTATNVLPLLSGLQSRTYIPANYAAPGFNTADSFPAPAPQRDPVTDPFPYTNTALSVFNGTSPNGTWSLYVVDDTSLENGSIGGWSMEIQTSDPVSPSAGVSIADLAVSVSGVPASAVIGASYTCTFTITNRGPAPAASVALLDQMPPGLALVSATVSAGTWSKVQGTLTWNIGSLPNGATASMTLVARPTVMGTLSSTATVSANQIDPNPGNNSVTMVTTAVEVPGLTISRVDNSLRLSWSAASGFRLQVNDSLNPANWADVGGAPQVVNGDNVVTVGIAGSSKFYRLRSP